MLVRLHARLASAFAMLVAFGAIAVHPLHAQSNVTIIVGTVTDASKKPVVGAVVEAFSIETEASRKNTTNDKGQYRIVFTDGGAQYRISVKAIGKNPKIFNVSQQSDDDRIVLDINLGDTPQKLQDLVSTVARRIDPNTLENRTTAGEGSRSISGDQALRLPIDASDMAALAALAPGVVLTPGTDSTASTFSVAGQSAASNTYVVNGATTATSTVPQDAIRSTRVITNTYDVSRGNFSGGMVSVTTKGGGNRVTGSLSSGLQNADLAWGGNTGTAFGQGQGQYSFGGGFGGPLHRHGTQNVTSLYGGFGYSTRRNPIASLDLADETTLLRLGASPDSVSKFQQLVKNTGLTDKVGAVSSTGANDAFNSVVRFDWNAGQIHVVTFTGTINLNGTDPQRIGQTSLPQVGGNTKGNSGNTGLQITSRFNNGIINVFNGNFAFNNSNSIPYLFVPAGRVTNYSDLDGGIVPVTLAFGGNSGLPQHNDTRSYEFTNRISLISPQGAHNWTLGLYANGTAFTQDATNNRYGTFTFNSLADFENNLASSYTRTLQPSIRSGASLNQAMYLSDAWRPRIGGGNNGNNGAPGGQGGGPGGDGGGRGGRGGAGFGGGGNGFGGGGNGGGNLQLNYGVRLEHSSYTGAPARNQAVFDEFHVDTHVLPSEYYASPRAGFSYSIAAPEQQGQAQRGFAPPLLTIRGGAGIFRGTMPSTLPGTAQAQSGLVGSQTQLFCTGAAVPIPDFSDYINHPEDIPSQCIDNASTPVINGTPRVTAYDPNYGASKTKRVSLGLTRRVTQRITFNIDASYVRGVGQGASRDLNLNETPRFTLGNEANRPVYADPAQIFPTTGQVPLSASRKDVAYSTVTDVFSTLQNTTKQITFNIAGTTTKQINLNFSYTLMSAQDQGGSGGGFGGGNITAGDPNQYDWATSSSQRRHNFQAQFQWPITPAFELTANLGVVSGTPYTPVVAGDINGDGSSRNDRAYIYNPSVASDTAVSNGMTRLLAGTSGNARKCLQAQLGQIASRNSCVGPWQPTAQFQVNWRPGLFDRRLALNFRTVNLLGGLDEWINGDNNIKGWGGNTTPDNTLLTVTGFNPATSQFKYSVNQRFGNTSGSATARRSPFQLYLGLQYAIGFDQRTAQIQQLARGLGGATSGTAVLDTAIMRYKRANVASQALDRKDSLVLSKEQITKLQALVDSSNKVLQVKVDSFRPEVDKVNKAQSAADFNTLFAKINPFQASLAQLHNSVRDQVQKILTDVQWALLPDSVKNANFNLFGGPGRGGAGGPGGQGAGGTGRGGRGGGE